MKYTRLKHQFVKNLPDLLEPGVIYLSIEYATAAHLCCCGCGVEVVTPITPTDWRMTFDGETISLWPSIGNWNEKCRSHYVIERSRIVSALPWSDSRIEEEWHRDRKAKENHYRAEQISVTSETMEPDVLDPQVSARSSWWSRVTGRFGKRKS